MPVTSATHTTGSKCVPVKQINQGSSSEKIEDSHLLANPVLLFLIVVINDLMSGHFVEMK
jgi:hypothetical protein